MTRSRQKIVVKASLVGLQDTAVEAHRPGTDGATIGVRVGATLFYLHDAGTARTFYHVWLSAGRQARNLPIEADRTTVLPMSGLSEPAVMMEMADSPPASAYWDPTQRVMRVNMGRILFDVADHGALRSTMAAFRHAAKIATTTFLPVQGASALDQAAHTAGRLFAAPARPATRPKAAGRPTSPVPSLGRTARPTLGRG